MNAYDVTLKTPDITLRFHILAESPDKAIADVQAFARCRSWAQSVRNHRLERMQQSGHQPSPERLTPLTRR